MPGFRILGDRVSFTRSGKVKGGTDGSEQMTFDFHIPMLIALILCLVSFLGYLCTKDALAGHLAEISFGALLGTLPSLRKS